MAVQRLLGGMVFVLSGSVALVVVRSQQRCVRARQRNPEFIIECWTTLAIEVLVLSILVAVVGVGVVVRTLRE